MSPRGIVWLVAIVLCGIIIWFVATYVGW